MAVPFRIGVMQLTMEPLDEMLASARAMDEAGMDTVWLAEAYPWWRKHQMEARGSTVVSALMARETTNLTIGWGIISPYTRHPVQVAMDARVVQEAAGPGRFIVGFGTSKIFLNNTKQGGPPKVTKPLAHMRDSVEIVRGILGGERFEYDGKVFSADIPALSDEAHAPRWDVPVYVAGTAPMMQQIGGEIGDGLLTPSITTPDYVRYTAGNIREGAAKSGRDPDDVDLGCTILASIHATDRETGRDGAREIGGMYLANKVQNIQGSADVLLESAGIDQEEIIPVAEAMEQRRTARGQGAGHRRAARQVQADRRHAVATASRRSRSTATPAAPTSCSSSGARTGSSRSASSARRCSRTSGTHEHRAEITVDRDRLVETAGRMIDVHSFTGDEQGDGRADGRALPARSGCSVQWQQVEDGRANALGTLARRRRRQDADVQRPHGHVVLGSRGVAARRARLPAAALRRRRPPLRARDLEHEGCARLLSSRPSRALQDAGVRLAGDVMIAAVCGEIEKTQYGDAQGAQYRGYAAGHALPRLPRRRRRHVPARRADRGQGRARSLRRALAADPGARQLHPHRVQRGQSATRTRSCGCTRCSRPCRSGSRPGRTTPRTATAARRRSSTSARSRVASAGASRGRRTTPTCSSTCACLRRSRWASRGARCSTWCAGSRSGSPPTGSRARCT